MFGDAHLGRVCALAAQGVGKAFTSDAPGGSITPAIRFYHMSARTLRHVPLKDGYFPVQAPKDFIEAAIREFTLRWVDFYR